MINKIYINLVFGIINVKNQTEDDVDSTSQSISHVCPKFVLNPCPNIKELKFKDFKIDPFIQSNLSVLGIERSLFFPHLF